MKATPIISQEKRDLYAAAMFPLMLQALYNSHQVLRNEAARIITKSEETPKEIDYGDGVIESYKDTNRIIQAFARLGIVPRYARRRINDNAFTLRHLHDLDVDKTIELFHADIVERDTVIDELKGKNENLRAHNVQICSAISERNKLLSKQNNFIRSFEPHYFNCVMDLEALIEILNDMDERYMTKDQLRLRRIRVIDSLKDITEHLNKDFEKHKKKVQELGEGLSKLETKITNKLEKENK